MTKRQLLCINILENLLAPWTYFPLGTWKLSLWTPTERVLLSFTFLETTKWEKLSVQRFFWQIFTDFKIPPHFDPSSLQSEFCFLGTLSLMNPPKWQSQKPASPHWNSGVLKTTNFSFLSTPYMPQKSRNFDSARVSSWQFQNLKTNEFSLKFSILFKNKFFDQFLWNIKALKNFPALNFSQPVLSSNSRTKTPASSMSWMEKFQLPVIHKILNPRVSFTLKVNVFLPCTHQKLRLEIFNLPCFSNLILLTI